MYLYSTTKNTLTEMVKMALQFAKEDSPDGVQFDVFSCLHVGKNEEFFEELKFHPGDGILNYYLYNWQLKGSIIKNHLINDPLI